MILMFEHSRSLTTKVQIENCWQQAQNLWPHRSLLSWIMLQSLKLDHQTRVIKFMTLVLLARGEKAKMNLWNTHLNLCYTLYNFPSNRLSFKCSQITNECSQWKFLKSSHEYEKLHCLHHEWWLMNISWWRVCISIIPIISSEKPLHLLFPILPETWINASI